MLPEVCRENWPPGEARPELATRGHAHPQHNGDRLALSTTGLTITVASVGTLAATAGVRLVLFLLLRRG